MDLQSFCVENRRKVHSFPLLKTTVRSAQDMSKSFQFGVPSDSIMEQNCFQKIHNISCAPFTFDGVAKNSDCSQKKMCFDQLNKFSHFSFSRVVGGFVGSKSQGGSASREPHQVWDIILRQLVDTACEAPFNSNKAQQYFNIGEAVSQSIFGQFGGDNTALDLSYIFTQSCNFFENKRTGTTQGPSRFSQAGSEDKRAGSTQNPSRSSQVISENKRTGSTQSPSHFSQASSKDKRAGSTQSPLRGSQASCESKRTGSTPSPSHTSQTSSADTSNTSMSKAVGDTQCPDAHVIKTEGKCKPDMEKSTPKQSYADVARSFAIARLDTICKPGRFQCGQNMQMQKNKTKGVRNSKRGNDKYNRREGQNNGYFPQSSYSQSSQKRQHGKCVDTLDKCDEQQVPIKFTRNKSEYDRHHKLEKPNVGRGKVKENDQQSAVSVKPEKCHEESRSKNYKMKNIRDKERKNIDQQVHEDISYVCTMPQQECKNWRCGHNRTRSAQRSWGDFNPQEWGSAKNCKQPRLHSPPPGAFGADDADSEDDKQEEQPVEEDCSGNSDMAEVVEVVLRDHEKPPCSPLPSPGSGDSSSSDSSLSSSSAETLTPPPQRPRVSSECSIESSDSSIVFERGDDDVDESDDDCDEDDDDDDDTDTVSDSDSTSEYNSQSDSDEEEDDDEVDFCLVFKSEDASEEPETVCKDTFSAVCDRLKNKVRWCEDDVPPAKRKSTKKVHFASGGELATVHPMVQWSYAYRQARRGPWEEIGRDRCRFQSRIQRVASTLSAILDPAHRQKIWEERMCVAGVT